MEVVMNPHITLLPSASPVKATTLSLRLPKTPPVLSPVEFSDSIVLLPPTSNTPFVPRLTLSLPITTPLAPGTIVAVPIKT